MIFRPTQQQYSPGSTFKMITALAALRAGKLNANTAVTCNGGYRLGSRVWRCDLERGHGPVQLHEALQRSCNVFFYHMGDVLGIDPIADMGHLFGLGSRTGIDVVAEVPGVMPDSALYKRLSPTGYTKGMALNTSIGQGDDNVTPLQLAMAYSALANGGTLYQPQIVTRIETPNGKVLPTVRAQGAPGAEAEPGAPAAGRRGAEGGGEPARRHGLRGAPQGRGGRGEDRDRAGDGAGGGAAQGEPGLVLDAGQRVVRLLRPGGRPGAGGGGDQRARRLRRQRCGPDRGARAGEVLRAAAAQPRRGGRVGDAGAAPLVRRPPRGGRPGGEEPGGGGRGEGRRGRRAPGPDGGRASAGEHPRVRGRAGRRSRRCRPPWPPPPPRPRAARRGAVGGDRARGARGRRGGPAGRGGGLGGDAGRAGRRDAEGRRPGRSAPAPGPETAKPEAIGREAPPSAETNVAP